MRISDWSSDVCSSDLPPRGLDLGDVDFLHPHHGFERALGGGRIRVGIDIHELARGYLPGQAPFVLAPAALAFLAAIADDSVPVAVGFLLRSEEHTSELQSLMRPSYARFSLKQHKKQTPA